MWGFGGNATIRPPIVNVESEGAHPVSEHDYNYSVFVGGQEEFQNFAAHAPKVTMRAPSFPLEDLATGETVEMKELWKGGVAVIEFGSFT